MSPKVEVKEPCLLCSCTGHISETPDIFKFSGAVDLPLLNHQLWNTFVLREILNLPTWKFQKMLETMGRSVQPSGWFSLCEKCSKIVHEIALAYDTIGQLTRKISKLKDSIKTTFGTSLRVKEERDADVPILNARVEIRAFLKDNLTEGNGSSGNNDTTTTEDIDFSHLYPTVNVEEYPEPEVEVSDSINELIGLNFLSKLTPATSPSKKVKRRKRSEKPIQPPKCRIRVSSAATCLESDRIPMQRKASKLLNGIVKDIITDDVELQHTKKRKRYHCKICPVQYFTQESLDQHEMLHARTRHLYEGRFDCFTCYHPYEDIPSLRRHLKNTHQLQLDMDFDGNSNQQDHVSKDVEEDDVPVPSLEPSPGGDVNPCVVGTGKGDGTVMYQCQMCPLTYNSSVHFLGHLRMHKRSKDNLNGKFDCCVCNSPHMTLLALRHHLSKDHRLQLKSDWDPSKPQLEYIQSLPELHGPGSVPKEEPNTKIKKGHRCPKCPVRCCTPTALKIHLAWHRKMAKKVRETVYCPECNFPCANEKALEIHNQIKHSKKA